MESKDIYLPAQMIIKYSFHTLDSMKKIVSKIHGSAFIRSLITIRIHIVISLMGNMFVLGETDIVEGPSDRFKIINVLV